MFVTISKIGWFLVQPVSLVAILMLLALLMGIFGWRRRSLAALTLASLMLLTMAFTTTGYLLIGGLESRFARPAQMPARVDGIIVLGGGMDADVNRVRGEYELTRSGDRFTEALRLALLYPEARIAVSGGAGVFAEGTDTEADAGARFFTAFGIAPGRLILEDTARNTEENAQLLKAMVEAQPGETWLLVTSAFHMPRSVGLFRKAGFEVVPWPADYFAAGNESFGVKFDQPAENISVTSIALRELSGLMIYRLAGKIDELFPGPATP